MRTCVFIIIFILGISLDIYGQDNNFQVDDNLHFAKEKLSEMIKQTSDSFRTPRTCKDGKLVCVPSNDWTSGFFAGSLWYMYEYSRDTLFCNAAQKWTKLLEKEQYNVYTHDLGFMLYCSYGNAYRIKHDENYNPILLQGAKSLCKRFNPKVGCIKSWESSKKWMYPVIIDNMMNLEYLFWATKATGDSSFYNIAVTHADTTLKNHFRPDYSTYHVVSYDSTKGSVMVKNTAQGAADESAWARGQSWGLYGYTVCYRETHFQRYLNQAQHIADFLIKNIPSDYVPYWDYSKTGEERDASAAAIMCSALLELCNYVDEAKKELYFRTAENILKELSTDKYKTANGEACGFILKHSVGSKPHHSEIDVPLVYADYYYIESLIQYKKLAH